MEYNGFTHKIKKLYKQGTWNLHPFNIRVPLYRFQGHIFFTLNKPIHVYTLIILLCAIVLFCRIDVLEMLVIISIEAPSLKFLSPVRLKPP